MFSYKLFLNKIYFNYLLLLDIFHSLFMFSSNTFLLCDSLQKKNDLINLRRGGQCNLNNNQNYFLYLIQKESNKRQSGIIPHNFCYK